MSWRQEVEKTASSNAVNNPSCAPPLANVRCPSGTKINRTICEDTYGGNHRLISSAAPAQNLRMSQWPMLRGLALILDIAYLLRGQAFQKIPRRRAVESRIARLDAEE